ncbi:MAG TPA: class I SAM-dependent methyltransferase [Bryobacteraceae bacterium]|nr:class I SAM-dependent methyltransferase [Bryobacteraceae bacterium]
MLSVRIFSPRLDGLADPHLTCGNEVRRPTMTLQPDDLKHIAGVTLQHYNDRAAEFWRATSGHDVSQNIEALLTYIEAPPPFAILDIGCGPGRDLKAFRELGHNPVGLDGSKRFVEMARGAGFDVWEQNLLALNLPANRFDGVFANAVLFHVPSQELPRVLSDLHTTLRPRGVLFSSNPRGQNEEGWNQSRYGAYYDFQTWRAFLLSAGFVELTHYYRPTGLPREEQPWLASVWRKP